MKSTLIHKLFLLTIFMVSLIIVLSCKKETINKPSFTWEKWEQQLPDTILFFTGSKRIIEFKEDSFRSKIQNWSDVCTKIYIRDSVGNIIDSIVDGCNSIDYVKGIYSKNNDSIFFNGKFFDSNYFTIQPNVADFSMRYKFFQSNDTTLILNPDRRNSYGDIVLKKR